MRESFRLSSQFILAILAIRGFLFWFSGSSSGAAAYSWPRRCWWRKSLWHLFKFKQPFNPEVFAQEEEKRKRQKLARLQNIAAFLNYQLVPQP